MRGSETMSYQIKAALWMSGAIASFIAMSIAGRAVQAELNTFELMFWRSLVGLVLICALVLAHRRPLRLRPTRPRLHALRHIAHFAGQNLWFFALMLIPLAQLVALEFTMPIWVALLAPLLLGEAFTRIRVLVAVLGFAGVLIVAQPGVQTLSIGHLAALGAAVGFALNIILTKRIMREDSVICVLFWMSLSQGLMALVLALFGGFTWPSPALWGWIVLVGITGLSAHFALSSALALAPATTVAPMEFFRLPLIALVGLWLYSEALDPLVFLGAGVIFAANWINLRNTDAVLPRQTLTGGRD